jgi:hypothetical protein
MGNENYGKQYQDPLQAQLQGEGQGQLEGQGQAQLGLQAQGQGEGQGQGQGQYESSTSLNGNGNLNLDGNGNLNLDGNGNFNTNENHNATCTDVSVNVDVSASITPLIGDTTDGIVLYMPQTFEDGAISGNGNQIALDQINSLVANTTADGNWVSNWDSTSTLSASNSGDAHAGDAIQGALATGELQAATSTAASVDAFTQSIVLGANIQSNSFNTTIAGGNQDTHVGDITSGASGHGHV